MTNLNLLEADSDSVVNFNWEPISFKIFDIPENDTYDIWDIHGIKILANNMLAHWQFQELVEYYVQNRMDKDLHNIEWSVEYAYDIYTKNPIPSSDEDSEVS
jgi:hypothetical protein